MFSSKPNKKDDLLRDAQASREERHLAKAKLTAAVKIQAFCRRALTVYRLRRLHRSKCDEIFPGGKDHVVKHSAADQFWCIRRWLFTFHAAEDEVRLRNVCQGILSSMAQPSSKVWYVSTISHSKLILPWISQVKAISSQALLQLAKIKPYKDTALVTIFLRIIVTFTDPGSWQMTALSGDAVKSRLKQLCRSVQSFLVEKGLFEALKELSMNGLCREESALTSASLLSIVTLALRPLSSSGYSTQHVTDFTCYILSVPAIATRLYTSAPQGLELLKQCSILKRVLMFLAEPANARLVFSNLHALKALCLLGNLVELYTKAPKESATELRKWFVSTSWNLLDMCQQYVGGKKGTSSSFHPLLGWFEQKATDERVVDCTTLVSRQILLLWSPGTVVLLLGDLLSFGISTESDSVSPKHGASDKPTATSMSVKAAGSDKKKGSSLWERFLNFKPLAPLMSSVKLDSPEARDLHTVCRLYHVCLKTFVPIKMDILTGLSCHPGLLPSLWHFLSSSATLDGMIDASQKESLISSHPLASVFTLFSSCCAHILAIVDDLELYEEQKPFTLEQLVSMSSFLNKLCFNLIWHAGSAAKAVPATGIRSTETTPSLTSAATVSAAAAKAGIGQVLSDSTSSLLSAAHSLLMLLYDRDCRRSFTLADHWTISSLPVATFLSELRRRQQRATTLLRMMPHALHYLERAKIFRNLVKDDKDRLGLSRNEFDPRAPAVYVTIRRGRLLEDGFEQMCKMSPDSVKGNIRIKFVNEQGLDEAGIDQDGVFKEFLEEIIKLVFDPNFALFKCVEQGDKVYPSSNSFVHARHLDLFDFVGRLLAKAVYEGIVIEVPFASFFLTQLLGRTHSFAYSSFDELSSMDAELYRRLSELKRYDGDVEDDFCLTFAVDEDQMGTIVTHDLQPGGRMINVTDANRISYIHLMANFKLCTQIHKQTTAFCRGFRCIIHPDWLVMFSPPELQRLISGDNKALDVSDLKKHVEYYGGFSGAHSVIRWLWDIVENDFDKREKGLFLKFVTSCSKPPVLGFAHLQPPLSIRLVELGDDSDNVDTVGSVLRNVFGMGSRARQSRDRLPTASTCFNMLKLPNYSKKSVLREKLRYAINANAGFELS